MESIIELSGRDTEVLRTLALVITPLLVCIVGWFIRSAMHDLKVASEDLAKKFVAIDKDMVAVKKDVESATEAIRSIRHIRDEWMGIKQEVGMIVIEMKNLKSSLEDVVLLKRDQQTIWKRIDELRQELREVQGK